MKPSRLSILITFSVVGCFLLCSNAGAYTASDYYNAGLQLYNAKNYQQAAQYFGAAISLDPNNTPALQGQANSYYSLGQYQQALDDYQKVRALQPSPQLASMIQALQAKVGPAASTTAPPVAGSLAAPPAPGAPASDSFAQGVALFQQQQYAQAVPLFQKAVQENSNDSKAYYYLGIAQIQTGDMKDAAVALGLSNKINPNPSVSAYVDRVKSRLSPEDQQWVDNQIASGNAGGSQSASASQPKAFGVRFEPSIFLVSLKDFDADAQANQAAVSQDQQFDPSETFNATVPTGYFGGGVEPVVRLGASFEIGLPFAILPVGTVSESYSDSQGNTDSESYNISAFSIGLNARYLMNIGKDMQVFIAGGPRFIPISIDYKSSSSDTSGTFDSKSGTFTSSAFGGQIQLGLDWHLGDTFVVSPFGGFQFASANLFTGTLTDNPTGGTATSNPAQLEVTKTSNGNQIYFLQKGQTPVSTSDRPVQMDLSGPFGGLQLSAFF
jgi:tetratricopeptide (TPR) repeat protein